jgi:putative oxidoreductase
MQTFTTTRSLPASSSALTSGLRALFETDATWTPAIARIALGVVMLPHGLQKTAGWFGGYGFNNTMHWFTDTMHVAWIFAFAAIIAESLGAVALIFGFATRLAAVGVAGVFLTAAVMVHAPFGFFMNWDGSQGGEGIEYFILGLALVAVVLVRGAGAASLDRVFAHRLNGRQ